MSLFEDGDSRQQEQDEAQQLAESLRIAAYVDAHLKGGEYGRAGFRYSDAGEVSPDGRSITAFNQAQNRAIQERKEKERSRK